MKWWHYVVYFFLGWAGLGFVITAILFTTEELPEPISFIGGVFFWTLLPALFLAVITFGVGSLTEFIRRKFLTKREFKDV